MDRKSNQNQEDLLIIMIKFYGQLLSRQCNGWQGIRGDKREEEKRGGEIEGQLSALF